MCIVNLSLNKYQITERQRPTTETLQEQGKTT